MACHRVRLVGPCRTRIPPRRVHDPSRTGPGRDSSVEATVVPTPTTTVESRGGRTVALSDQASGQLNWPLTCGREQSNCVRSGCDSATVAPEADSMMPDRHPSAVILFAKAPAVGRVKTRLAVRMAAKEATRLYEAFLRDSLAIVRAAKCDLRVLAYTPPEAEAEMKQMASKGFWFHEQAGRDLGERMVDAFKTAFEEGFRRVVILGADSPTLPVRYVNHALQALRKVDVVLGPALDGGYYL
ncbi:MAG: glycosyltransferase, partial [Planctomycetes bacterium]|nr:glycosyltransferase [Planctomycetota bacterium]